MYEREGERRGSIPSRVAHFCPLAGPVHAVGMTNIHAPPLQHICFHLFLWGDFIQGRGPRLCSPHRLSGEMRVIGLPCWTHSLPFSVSLAAGLNHEGVDRYRCDEFRSRAR